MVTTNRDQLIAYITARIDACLAQNPTVFPSVNSWLRATPGVISNTTSGAPPVVIGWLNQVLYDTTTATSEAVALTVGNNIMAIVKNPTSSSVVVGSAIITDPVLTGDPAMGA